MVRTDDYDGDEDEWVPVSRAAQAYGISPAGVRQRFKRGQIPRRKGPNGRFVYRLTQETVERQEDDDDGRRQVIDTDGYDSGQSDDYDERRRADLDRYDRNQIPRAPGGNEETTSILVHLVQTLMEPNREMFRHYTDELRSQRARIRQLEEERARQLDDRQEAIEVLEKANARKADSSAKSWEAAATMMGQHGPDVLSAILARIKPSE